MSAEAGLAAAGGGILTTEFALSHGAVMLGMAFMAAAGIFDPHSFLVHGIAEPVLGV